MCHKVAGATKTNALDMKSANNVHISMLLSHGCVGRSTPTLIAPSSTVRIAGVHTAYETVGVRTHTRTAIRSTAATATTHINVRGVAATPTQENIR